MNKTFVRLMPVSDDFGERLRTLRTNRGWSMRDLSFPGCSYALLSRLENGERNPSLQMVLALAERLEVHPRELGVSERVCKLFER